MKKTMILLLCILGYVNSIAQDTFQSELFAAETVLKYRSDLELTDDQVRIIKKIYNDNITDFNTTKWDLDALQVGINKLISKSKVDEKEALLKMEEISILEQKLKKQRLKMLVKIKNELTEKQQNRLKELRDDTDLSALNITTPISENPRIVIRGSATKDGKSPLFIIFNKNGEEKYKGSKGEGKLKALDPNNIESVNVIKGKAATLKYGKEGENGVIEIKTKDK